MIFRQTSEPSGLLISAVFDEIILPKTMGATLQIVELGVIVACGSLKLCEPGGDRPCCSGGGVTSAVALELKSSISIDEPGTVGSGVEKIGTHNTDLRYNTPLPR